MFRTKKGTQRMAIQMAALRSDQYEMMMAQALNSLATDNAYLWKESQLCFLSAFQ